MSARLKTTRAIAPPRRPAAPQSGTSLKLPSAVTQAQSALHACVGALCAIEVTLHSLELQDIAPSEQEVLKRAHHSVSCVQEWLAESALRALLQDVNRMSHSHGEE